MGSKTYWGDTAHYTSGLHASLKKHRIIWGGTPPRKIINWEGGGYTTHEDEPYWAGTQLKQIVDWDTTLTNSGQIKGEQRTWNCDQSDVHTSMPTSPNVNEEGVEGDEDITGFLRRAFK